MNALTPISLDTVREALAFISPDLPRDEWIRVLAAINSEFPDDAGFVVADDWSSRGKTYNSREMKSVWKGLEPGGPVKIGTLIRLAKQNGFQFPKDDAERKAPDPEAQAEARRLREAQREKQALQAERMHQETATKATALWDAASETGASPYLERKGVKAYGVRFDGLDVLVPARDTDGALWTIERIHPNGTKRFLKNGRKSGRFHLIGEPSAALDAVLVCEGYATGASLHEASGIPVAVAFDAGNLEHVAVALRAAYPDAQVIVAGDDDRETEAQSGTNPGRVKARTAARAAKGVAVFPEGLPKGGSDFNDLHQHLGGVAGLQAVREIIERKGLAARGGRRAARAGPQAGKRQDAGHELFQLDQSGVWYYGVDQDGKRKPGVWVCSWLDVRAQTCDEDGGSWGLELVFVTPEGKQVSRVISKRLLATDGAELRSLLMEMGVEISSSPRVRPLLLNYIASRPVDEIARHTERTGWFGPAYVFPNYVAGHPLERILHQPETASVNPYRVRGTVEQWRLGISLFCAGNSTLTFAVACGFAGPLLRFGGVESGGIHFVGPSSIGKTSIIRAAASIYGGPSFVETWLQTANHLEPTAEMRNDNVLILDEVKQIDAKIFGETIYMLGNGQGKGRATRNGAPRPRRRWGLMILSTGELSVQNHMASAQKQTYAGQQVRMVDVPVSPAMGAGLFDNLHGIKSPAEFSKYIVSQAGEYYGAVGVAWVEWLIDHIDGLEERVRQLMDRFVKTVVPESASGQVWRVADRFAIIAAAGELATEAGLTGWDKGAAQLAAHACFNAWLAARGGIEDAEVSSMIRQVRQFLELHGDGRFPFLHRAAEDRPNRTINRAGYRMLVDPETRREVKRPGGGAIPGDEDTFIDSSRLDTDYLVLPETFKTEVCRGFDPKAVAHQLALRDLLVSREPGRHQDQQRVPGLGKIRCYRISSRIFSNED